MIVSRKQRLEFTKNRWERTECGPFHSHARWGSAVYGIRRGIYGTLAGRTRAKGGIAFILDLDGCGNAHLYDHCPSERGRVDTSGTALVVTLAHPGVSIKVNGNEIGEALGFEVKDMPSAQRALTVLVERGLSAVGSGDSFLGGLVNALDSGSDWAEALEGAVAAGTANTLSAGGGRFALQEFTSIREQVQIRTW